jgi:hypothetical protein
MTHIGETILSHYHSFNNMTFLNCQCVLYLTYAIFFCSYGAFLLSFQASADQTTIDDVLAFFVGLTISMYISVLSTVIVTCQVAWPSVIAVIPLLLLNIWYKVCYLKFISNTLACSAHTKHISYCCLNVPLFFRTATLKRLGS